MEEIWKDIKDYVGLYQVSNLGRVKSLKRRVKKWNGYRMIGEKILKSKLDKNGYCLITLCKNNIDKTFKMHRLVAQSFIPNPQNKPEINHKNNQKQKNYVKNLEWVTSKENKQHSIKNGWFHTAKGENNGHAKLTEKQVLEIRNLYPKLNQLQLAKKYDVGGTTIHDIVHKIHWKHI